MILLIKSIYQQWKVSKICFVTILLTSILGISLMYFEVNVLKNIIQYSSKGEINIATKFMVYYVAIAGAIILIQPLQKYLYEKIKVKNMYIVNNIASKISKVSINQFDDEKKVQLIERTKQEPEEKITDLFSNFVSLTTEVLSILCIIFIAREAGVVFIALLLVLVIVMFVMMSVIKKLTIGNYFSREELTRKETYLNSLFFDRDISLERKNYDYHSFIDEKLVNEVKVTNKKMKKNIRKIHLVSWLFENASYLFVVLAYLLLLIPLGSGKIGFSLLIALIPAMKRVSSYFMIIINNRVPTIIENVEFLADLEKLNDLPEQYYVKSANQSSKEIKTIEFRDVCYSYPNGKQVINDLNLLLVDNVSYALVGHNGCGKSTLMKLMIGFYTPTSGQILYNGIPASEYSFEDKMNNFGIVFQDFAKFDFTVLENITMNDSVTISNDVINAVSLANIDKDINNMKDKYSTKLGKLLGDGIDMSIGQWQKLSVARMLYENKRIRIFDEPTASLDPISESTMYKNYIEHIKDVGLSLFVTHRLGATTLVDEILVMEDGKIIENGTHTQLVECKTVYSAMYTKQRGLYI